MQSTVLHHIACLVRARADFEFMHNPLWLRPHAIWRGMQATRPPIQGRSAPRVNTTQTSSLQTLWPLRPKAPASETHDHTPRKLEAMAYMYSSNNTGYVRVMALPSRIDRNRCDRRCQGALALAPPEPFPDLLPTNSRLMTNIARKTRATPNKSVL